MSATFDVRRCRHCGGEIPSTARSDRVFCRDGCRNGAYKQRRRAQERAAERSSPIARAAALPPEQQAVLDQALAEPRLVALVAQAANRGTWRAAAFLLERHYPERWGPQRAVRGDLPRPLIDDEGDAFAEVDQLAELRRRRSPPDY
jgi:hypothetical protein